MTNDDHNTMLTRAHHTVTQFLNSAWFPDDMVTKQALSFRQSEHFPAYPRTAAVLMMVTMFACMTVVSMATSGTLNLHVGLVVQTIAGNLIPALVVLAWYGLRIQGDRLSVVRVGWALVMGVVFCITATLLTGLMNTIISGLLEGTPLWNWWERLIDDRDSSYAMILSPKTVLETILVYVAVAISPGIFEEFLFRGVVYRMMSSVKTWRRVVFIGILFGLIHFDLIGFVPLCLFGIVLCWLRACTGSWLTSAVVHAGFNATSITMAIVGNAMVGDMPVERVEGMESMEFITVLVLAPLVLLSAWIFKKYVLTFHAVGNKLQKVTQH